MFASFLGKSRGALLAGLGFSLAACAGTAPAPTSPVSGPAAAISKPAPPITPGMAADNLRALYGKPTFVRNESDSELWRYDGEKCSAFFFFYHADGPSGPLTLKYMETDPKGASASADLACLSGIWARAQAAS